MSADGEVDAAQRSGWRPIAQSLCVIPTWMMEARSRYALVNMPLRAAVNLPTCLPVNTDHIPSIQVQAGM